VSPGNQICLVDTNIILRFADSTDPLHDSVHRAVRTTSQRYDLRVSSQTLVESWNVMTRPRDRNGFGQSVAEAEKNLSLIERIFPRLPDSVNTYERWRELVIRFGVRGVQVHDARLVALMLTQGLTRILTFNAQDFARYSDLGIEPIVPDPL